MDDHKEPRVTEQADDEYEAPKVCIHPLATRPVLYTDTVGGNQTCRDDLWAVTTDELNALHRQAAPVAPTCQWPTCQPEEVQQQVAKEVHDALYGDPAATTASASQEAQATHAGAVDEQYETCGACGGTGYYASGSTDECEDCKGEGEVVVSGKEWQ